jgi:ribosomal protein L14E/L6E/L27E
METRNLIGGAWLATHHGLNLVTHLAVQSRIGGRRKTELADGVAIETFVEAMRPAPGLRGHLTFHLKHEVLHLELLSRLFAQLDPAELVDWIQQEPSGQYARKAGFLYEWLTGRELEITATIGGAYVDVLDDRKLVAASPSQSVKNRRWRVRDNLPGTAAFCPIVRKTRDWTTAVAVDVRRLLQDLAAEFGEEALLRSAVWMTLRESKASFAIEGEADQVDRIHRFAAVLARRTGEGELPLSEPALRDLQREILGGRTTLQQFGLRQSPVFVGEVVRFQEVVHYVAPPADALDRMLNGLEVFWTRTQEQPAVMRSAVLAFGFVYIHPLADGNGRVHRFLINDVLRRDGVVQEPVIVPVSALISRDAAEQRAYTRLLDTISRPLMVALAGTYAFAENQTTYPDGIHSNFEFSGEPVARPLWRYLDLTEHVVWLADALKRTIHEHMRQEAYYLQRHAEARAAIKEIIEMPNLQIDRIIRSAEANQGKLSNALAKEIPALTQAGLWDSIVNAIAIAFHQPAEGSGELD